MRTYRKQSTKAASVVKMKPGKFRESTLKLAEILAPAVCRMLDDPNTVFMRPIPTRDQQRFIAGMK